MKILHVNKFFDLNGGAEVYLHSLIKKQQEAGHEVHAFSTRSERNLPTVDKNYFVTRYAYDKAEGAVLDLKKAKNFVWNTEAEKSFERQISDLKPDVVHLHNIYHHLSTSLLRVINRHSIPCFQTLHDYKLACPNYKMFVGGRPCERCRGGKYYNAVCHGCLGGFWPSLLASSEMYMTKFFQSYEKAVMRFICPSEFMRRKMEDWGEPPGKLVYLPNPVEQVKQLSAERGTGDYVYVGRLSAEKGPEILIRAFLRANTQSRLLIIGDGPQKHELHKLVEQSGSDKVEFLGFLDSALVAEQVSKAKALIQPTLMYENSSLSILEAMALGTPVIASNLGGIPELAQDGINGFLVDPGKIESLIEAINQMETFSPEQRLEMGDAGRELVNQKHTWEKHLTGLERIYGND